MGGACASSPAAAEVADAAARRAAQLEAFAPLLSALGITAAEANALYDAFEHADIDHDLLISREELVRLLGIGDALDAAAAGLPAGADGHADAGAVAGAGADMGAGTGADAGAGTGAEASTAAAAARSSGPDSGLISRGSSSASVAPAAAIVVPPFALRIFSLFDIDGSGELDFGEWCSSFWQFLSMTRASLAMLAFRMLDADKDGTLSGGEIEQMLVQLAGSDELAKEALAAMALQPAEEAEVAATAVADGDGSTASFEGGAGENGEATGPAVVSAAEAAGPADAASAKLAAQVVLDEESFLAFALAHPSVTQPALKLQALLRSKICGEAFWEAALRKRGAGKELEAEAELARARAFAAAAERVPAALAASARTAKTGGGAGGAGDLGVIADADAVAAAARLLRGDGGISPADASAAAEAASAANELVGAVADAAAAELEAGYTTILTFRVARRYLKRPRFGRRAKAQAPPPEDYQGPAKGWRLPSFGKRRKAAAVAAEAEVGGPVASAASPSSS
jgi:Ca2+-binding EF-hand superfamily protein